jgi:DNA primase small subunit
MEDGALEKVRKGNLDLFKGSADIWMKLLRERLSGEGVSMGLYIDDERGETDEPVTADVRRLIRFPSSLHGGSGLRVTPLTIEGLDAFNPLIDAVVFGDSPVIVDVTRQFAFDLKGESYSLDLGRAELPECAAVFFLARGAGELVKAR